VFAFLDGDYRDHPEEIVSLLAPIAAGVFEFVLGNRVLLSDSRMPLFPQALYGNLLATHRIKWFWRYEYTDLGP